MAPIDPPTDGAGKSNEDQDKTTDPEQQQQPPKEENHTLNIPPIKITNTKGEYYEVRDTQGRRSRSNSTSVSAELVCKFMAQRDRLASLRTLLNTIEAHKNAACEAMYNQWRSEATDLMETSKEQHAYIEAHSTAESIKDDYFTEQTLQLTHVAFSSCLLAIIKGEQLLKSANAQPSAPAQHSSARNTKLPPISLPRFSGSYSEWQTFKEMFTGMVLNDERLSDIERLHYLRDSLSAQALTLIEGLPLVGTSLSTSWQLLIDRFENKRFIMASHLEQLNTLGPAQPKNSTSLNKLIASVSKIRQAVLTLTTKEELGDCLLTNHVVRLLDRPSREAWETSLGTANAHEFPTFEQLEAFLVARVRTLEQVEGRDSPSKNGNKTAKAMVGATAQGGRSSPASSSSQRSEAAKPTHSDRISKQYPCSCCNGTHFIVACPKFKELSIPERRTLIMTKSLCYNCFGKHRATSCLTLARCKICRSAHHTMIHLDAIPATEASAQDNGAHSNSGTSHQHAQNSLLATAVAWLETSTLSHQVRMLIDPGSELTFVSEQLIDSFNIKRLHSSVSIYGIGGMKATHTHGKVLITLKSMHRAHQVQVTAHILRKMCSTLPTFVCDERKWPHINNLCLADSTFGQPRNIDLIIGADHYGSIIKPNIIKGSSDEPIAQLSIFGWLVLGPTNSSDVSIKNVHHARVALSDDSLQETLTKFWLMEEAPTSSKALLTPEEAFCEQHFMETHTRNHEGKYIVRLPLKADVSQLGSSLARAQACLKRTLHKFERDPEYKKLYTDFMDEYAQLGHMVPAPAQPTSSAFYLPHHGVLKTDSPTTKLRVVFNGSAHTSSGLSLNDIMHTGPNLLLNIVDVLTWIRSFKFVFATDITKMYRQILVHPDDWDLQRIIWIDEQLKEKAFQLTTVTYGTRAAPFLAIRVLCQLLQDEGKKYPLAYDSLNAGRYVDDIFGGADTVDVLTEKATQLQGLCMAGGFPLAKWNSNHPDLTQKFSTQTSKVSSISLSDSSTKILGLSWLPLQDVLTFTIKLPPPQRIVTKRNLLSELSQIYDPIGIISPVVIKAKILLQELWLQKISWDELVINSIGSKWLLIREDFAHLEQISLPRWYGTMEDSTIDIHGFSDASQLAMAAVLYVRVHNPTTGTTSSFVCSKTKVAPLKHVSIPRLELAAAHLLAILTQHFMETLKVEVNSVNLWTDSKVTLAWIRSHPSRWKDFVRNRVSFIQESLPSAQWRHVPGGQNPADCASRGLLTSQLINHELWWNGPHWLTQHEDTWPAQHDTLENEELPEQRQHVSLIAATKPLESIGNLLDKYSSLHKLLAVTAWLFLACERFRRKPAKMLLTSAMINKAKLYWIKVVQQHYFAEEIKLIQSSSVPKWHIFNRLTAYIDSQGIIRLGGRLQRAKIDEHSKHPAILPRNSTLSSLIIDKAHRDTLHGGTQLTLAKIRQEVWIIGGRAPVKSHILHCVTCARQRAIRAEQLMGQLPMARVTPSRPFTHTGVDYAGPISIKAWKGRGSKTYKGWICAFVCLSTSAVHLEAVSDYSLDGFIAAHRRFSSRRGLPSQLYSDCGTNFKGAYQELKTLMKQAQKENSHLASVLLKDGVQWNFNPPGAPHMGGKWEAAVKSIKFHFKRTIENHLLTFEELTTFLTQVECILNSRPLEPLSDDPEDQEVLTPGHFLIGSALNSPPEPSILDLSQSRLSRWQLIQQKTQQFWKQWSAQYLQQLQAISKWKHPSHTIQVGSIVLIMNECLPPGKWPIARVTDTHPGEDGLTRVVTLKTATTQLVRPIAKLALLPVYDQLNNNQPRG